MTFFGRKLAGSWCPLATAATLARRSLASAEETGRQCVLLARHRHACVVGRAGIRDLLDRHLSTQPVYLDVLPKFPDGWRAHQSVLAFLDRPEHRVMGT